MKRISSIATTVAILGAWLLAAEAAGPLTLATSVLLGSRAHDLVLDVGRSDHCLSAPPCDFAHVVTDVGLSVVDITQRTAPVVRGSVNLGGRGFGLDRQGSLVFVASERAGLKVVDVSDPDEPVVVGSRPIPGSGGARDVAVKADADAGGGAVALGGVVYVASWPGELFVIRHSRPAPTAANPRPPVTLTPIRTIGILAWGLNNTNDAAYLAKMNQYVTVGSAKISGVSITGNTLVTLDFTWGRLVFYDVARADDPIFKGTHAAPFMFRAEVHPAGAVAYGFAASSAKSGIYSYPIDLLNPNASTRFDICAACDYFKSPPTDYGGFGISSNGRYVIFLAGKQGVIQVINVSDPSNMVDDCEVNGAVAPCSLPIVGHGIKSSEPMGAQTLGDYIFAAVGNLGFRVYSYHGISN